MATITMDTDWGAKGAQLTGAQVQAFIKGELISLHEKDAELEERIEGLDSETIVTQITDLQNKDIELENSIKTIKSDLDVDNINSKFKELQDKDLELEATINNIEAPNVGEDIAALQAKDAELEGRLNSLEVPNVGDDIAALQAKDSELEERINNLDVNALEGEINALKEADDEINNKLEELSAPATQSSPGLMSPEDKKKLDELENGSGSSSGEGGANTVTYRLKTNFTNVTYDPNTGKYSDNNLQVSVIRQDGESAPEELDSARLYDDNLGNMSNNPYGIKVELTGADNILDADYNFLKGNGGYRLYQRELPATVRLYLNNVEIESLTIPFIQSGTEGHNAVSYKLSPNITSVSYNPNTGEYSQNNLEVSVIRQEGDNAPEVLSAFNLYDESEGNMSHNPYNIKIELRGSDGNIIDSDYNFLKGNGGYTLNEAELPATLQMLYGNVEIESMTIPIVRHGDNAAIVPGADSFLRLMLVMDFTNGYVTTLFNPYNLSLIYNKETKEVDVTPILNRFPYLNGKENTRILCMYKGKIICPSIYEHNIDMALLDDFSDSEGHFMIFIC